MAADSILNSLINPVFSALGMAAGLPVNRQIETGALSPLALVGPDKNWRPIYEQLNVTLANSEEAIGSLILDFSNLESSEDLRVLQGIIQPLIKRIKSQASIIIIGLTDSACPSPSLAAVHQGLVGLTKSLAKELGKRAIRVNMLKLGAQQIEWAFAPAEFLLTPRSAYISGQVFEITDPAEPKFPLTGKTALVTGASRGIGAAIAKQLHQAGANIIGLDIPQMESELADTLEPLEGIPLLLDISSPEAPIKLNEFLNFHKGLDIIVHNAGITRDKTMKRMPEHHWQQVIDINLNAVIRLNESLLESGHLKDNSHIVCVSSMNGIAGQVGQTNYSTSKAGIIGYVNKMAKQLPEGMRINAVAPGFIETQMTDQIPFMTREFGRRLNALGQGGKPEDVANTIQFLSCSASRGISGQTIRVCGLSLPGA